MPPSIAEPRAVRNCFRFQRNDAQHAQGRRDAQNLQWPRRLMKKDEPDRHHRQRV
jgi:hypothetical protein